MILLIDTSTPICKIRIIDNNLDMTVEWLSERNLAKSLHKFIHDNLIKLNKDWTDLSSMGVFQGPGSFTGLRIGLTVANTLADTLDVPIVGSRGDKWQDDVLQKLRLGVNDKIVLPYYGREANITKARK